MLLAVEGGRLFSSSASGYSNGLNLLLLGHKKEEKPMRVTPWSQYHLVDQESDPNLQLAANKNRCVCGCASFACFGQPAAGLESPSVGPTTHHQHDTVETSSNLDNIKENSHMSDCMDGHRLTNSINSDSLKSSLKKRDTAVSVSVAVNNDDEVQPVHQNDSNAPGCIDRKSIQWTDVTGGELFEIREFEPSEHSDSDDEFENSTGKTCSCIIM